MDAFPRADSDVNEHHRPGIIFPANIVERGVYSQSVSTNGQTGIMLPVRVVRTYLLIKKASIRIVLLRTLHAHFYEKSMLSTITSPPPLAPAFV